MPTRDQSRRAATAPIVSWRGYAVAVGATAAALLARFALDPFLGNHLPYVTFFVAVAAVVWFCHSLAPAITAVVLGAMAAQWFFAPPRFSLYLPDAQQQVGLAAYFMVALAFVGFGQALQRAGRRAETLAAERDEQRERLRVTLASIGDAVIVCDAQGSVTYLNTVAEKLTGWKQAEAAGSPLDRVFHIINERTRHPVESPCARVLREGLLVGLANHTLLIARDGTERAIDDSAAPIRDAAGSIAGVVLIFRDVTERRQAAAALAASEQLYRLTTETAADGIITMDDQSIIMAVNPAAERIFGYSAGELIGQSMTRLIPERMRARHRAGVERFIATGQRNIPWEGVELPGLTKDGREIPLEISFGAHLKDGRQLFTGTIRDITARKQAEQLLQSEAKLLEVLVQQRTAKLQEAIAELEAFSYIVAHDLRAPLRAMSGYAKALSEEAGLSEDGHAYLERIQRAAARLDRLTQEVLSYSQISRGELNLTPIDLDKLAHELVEQYPAITMHRENIEICSPLLPVIGHEPLLAQALSNLLINACKFVATGVTPKVLLRTEESPPSTWVRIWVEDNGIGIEPRHQERIFKLFERIHPDHKYEGTGVGLAIVKKAVERMGGTAGFESEPGKGSRFWIQLRAPK